jgi:hypothetical protein
MGNLTLNRRYFAVPRPIRAVLATERCVLEVAAQLVVVMASGLSDLYSSNTK